MKIINLLKKIAIKIEKRQNNMFSFNVEKQKKYIEKFPEPIDNIERAYYQYKCQMKLYGKIMEFILNIFSIFVLSFLLIKIKQDKDYTVKKKEAVFFRDGKPNNILPKTLFQEFKKIEYNPADKMSLNKKDKIYLKNIFKRYPLSWHFLLKNTIKIAKYSYAIDVYKPKAVICCSEYSFTSSVLTDYCNNNNIELINVMHGEKVYFMRDSFFRFNRCYVWNEYYIEIFNLLRADKGQFIVELPPSMIFKDDCKYIEKNVDYTYYLAAENIEELQKIANLLRKIKQMKNAKIAIRPHPRYTDVKKIKKIFSDFEIEDTKILTIEESISRTKNAIALYSTVLNQAISNGTNIIIDDISVKSKFEKLKDIKYIFANKEIQRISKVIEG